MLKKLYLFLFVNDLLQSSALSVAVKSEPLKLKLMRDVSRVVLLAYVLFIFKPAVPIIADTIAHTFWKDYHILTVHQINGKYHVHVELASMAKQSEKEKSQSPKFGAEEFSHLMVITSFNFLLPNYLHRPYATYNFHTPISYPDINDQPPKMV